MKNTKRTVCLLMAFCLLFGLMSGGVLAVEEISFSDVAKDAWYYDPITKAVEKGIVVGNADGTYAPRGTLTWAQTITFAVRLDQLRKGEDVYGSEDQTGAWYDIYVDYALEKGIINSKPVTPGGTITRADAAIIFSKVLGEYTPVNEVADGYFTDVRAAHPAHDAIYMLAEAGICNGKDKGVFGINDSFLRSEVAAIVARMAGLVDKVYIQTGEVGEFFSLLDGKKFTYTHSLGGSTTLEISQNGLFSGQFMRYRAAETGADYSKGTIYIANFTGRFSNAVDSGNGVHELTVADLKLSAQPGSVVLKDGYRYVAVDAYGLDGGSTVQLYTSGANTATMPECMLNALIVAKSWGGTVPSRTVGDIIYNPNNHRVMVEEISASVSTAKLFATLEGKTFAFTTGAGGSHTTITFGANGSFTGSYRDSEMGLVGDKYPNGTVYTCEFYGSFADPKWESDYKYSLRLDGLYLKQALGVETIEDGIRYVTTSANGFEKAGYFTVYLPGSPISKVAAPVVSHVGNVEGWGTAVPTSLPCWTLYNIGGQITFVSYD